MGNCKIIYISTDMRRVCDPQVMEIAGDYGITVEEIGATLHPEVAGTISINRARHSLDGWRQRIPAHKARFI